jgi:hypothetical protein
LPASIVELFCGKKGTRDPYPSRGLEHICDTLEGRFCITPQHDGAVRRGRFLLIEPALEFTKRYLTAPRKILPSLTIVTT